MVFSTISESEPSASTVPMGSIKSQPLHNFSLTDLKWSPAQHRLRRQSADSNQRPPLNDFAPRPAEPDAGISRPRVLNDLPPVSARDAVEAWDKKDKGEPGSAPAAGGRSSKIVLRFRTKEKPSDTPAEVEAEAPVGRGRVSASPAEPEEPITRVWNLRPRKPVTKKSSTGQIVGGAMSNGVALDGSDRAEAERMAKVSIPLTKEEIEVDFLAFTGSRPARRPKKRAKIIQRDLNRCFPGLWLANITPDSYKVVDKPPKARI